MNRRTIIVMTRWPRSSRQRLGGVAGRSDAQPSVQERRTRPRTVRSFPVIATAPGEEPPFIAVGRIA